MAKSVEERWLLSQRPRKLKISAAGRKAIFAVVVVLAADSNLVVQVPADLQEMVAGVSDAVSVLLLVDLPGEAGASIVEITPAGIRPLAKLPVLSTGDPRPLADFFGRALVSYSAGTRFALGFWGHGKGVFGDDDRHEVLLPAALLKMPLPAEPRRRRRRAGVGVEAASMLPDDGAHDSLTNREARSALGAAFARAGRTEPVDIIFSDTCLNGSVEVYTELREFTRTVVASSLVMPPEGWNYTFWLKLTASSIPTDALEWARLAVGAFGAAYPQEPGTPPAQLAAFSTRESDLIKAFAGVVKALAERGEAGGKLLSRAANRVQSVQYRENLDFEQLVRWLLTLTLAEDDEPLRDICQLCLDAFRAALVGISASPVGGSDLSGLTIWCPIKGDLKRVSSYYGKLEFCKKTKWLKLLKTMSS